MKAGCKISQKQPAVVKVKMLFSISQKEGKRSIVKLGEMICEIKVHLASNSIFSKSSSAQDTAGCSCTLVSLGEAVPAHHFGGAGPQHLTVQHYMPVHPVRVSICLLGGEISDVQGKTLPKPKIRLQFVPEAGTRAAAALQCLGDNFYHAPAMTGGRVPANLVYLPGYFK